MEAKPKATITRPTVARALQAAGYAVTPIQSIWDPSRTDWEYDLDATSARIVLEAYEKIGKKPPIAVRSFLKEQEAVAQ
jgi:hypothetical protein